MRIAVDAMGGDHAPAEVVKGALIVAQEDPETQILLVGDQAAIEPLLNAASSIPVNLTIHHTPEAIGMSEHPVHAIRKKRNSSLVVAGLLVKSGEVDGTFSAGNTGAAMAVATLDIGRIPGIERPAIATTLPTFKGNAILIDAGANVDCEPRHLLQFGWLASVYVQKVFGIDVPSVGLLNIGAEESKGNELSKAAYTLLKESKLNFVGNVEGKDVFEHGADVVVCDGFAGNILLKTGEGVAEMIVAILQREIAQDPRAAESLDIFKPILRRLKQRIDYSETGGAPLLGINGVSFIGHGRSTAKAIASGIRQTCKAAASGFVAATRQALDSSSER